MWLQNVWIKIKGQNYFLFELMLISRIVACLAPSVTTKMLMQDKICLFNYNQSASFCEDIQKEASGPNHVAEQNMKNDILAKTAIFMNYKQILETVPIVLWSLFLGPFLDKYPSGAYIILFINAIGDSFISISNILLVQLFDTSANYLIIPSAINFLTGGFQTFTTIAGLYITMNTAEKDRALKFVILEIIIILGMGSAIYIGGLFLKINKAGPQLRKYNLNYYLSISLNVICLIFLSLLYWQKKSETKSKTVNNKGIVVEDKNNNNNIDGDLDRSRFKVIKLLFDIDNVRETLVCFFRPRPHNVRLQILLLSSIQFIQMLVTRGISDVLLQFAQKAYHWDPVTYSKLSSIEMMGSMALLAIFSGIFISWLHFTDNTLIIIAQVSTFLADLNRGTFLSPMAYFISLPIGSFSGFAVVSAKSKFSKIIPLNEIGKIYSLSGTIDAINPLFGSIIYSNIFALSIGTYTGLVYHFSCFLMLLSIVALIVEERYCPVKSQENPIDDDQNDNSIKL